MCCADVWIWDISVGLWCLGACKEDAVGLCQTNSSRMEGCIGKGHPIHPLPYLHYVVLLRFDVTFFEVCCADVWICDNTVVLWCLGACKEGAVGLC